MNWNLSVTALWCLREWPSSPVYTRKKSIFQHFLPWIWQSIILTRLLIFQEKRPLMLQRRLFLMSATQQNTYISQPQQPNSCKFSANWKTQGPYSNEGHTKSPVQSLVNAWQLVGNILAFWSSYRYMECMRGKNSTEPNLGISNWFWLFEE